MTSDKSQERSPGDYPVADVAALRLFYQSTLDAMAPNVAVIARGGRILAVNVAWRAFLTEHGIEDPDFDVGGDYLALCDREGDPDSLAMAAGIRALLEGGTGPFRLEYPCRWTRGRRWSRMSALRVGSLAQPYVIVSHEDITDILYREQKQREMTGRLLLAEDEERRRIGRDIHDGAAQKLAAAKLLLARGPVGVADAQTLLTEAIDELRTLSDHLHPPMLEPLGLAAAIRRLAMRFGRDTGLDVALHLPEQLPRLARPTEITLYRATQEALENVAAHSGSARVEVRLTADGGKARLAVRDFGQGLAEGRGGDGDGLGGLRLRVEQLGGGVTLEPSTPGLCLVVELPMQPAGTADLIGGVDGA